MTDINMLVSEILVENDKTYSRAGMVGNTTISNIGLGAAGGLVGHALGGLVGHALGRYTLKRKLNSLKDSIKTEKDPSKKQEIAHTINIIEKQLEKTSGLKGYAKGGLVGAGIGGVIGTAGGLAMTSGHPKGIRFRG